MGCCGGGLEARSRTIYALIAGVGQQTPSALCTGMNIVPGQQSPPLMISTQDVKQGPHRSVTHGEEGRCIMPS